MRTNIERVFFFVMFWKYMARVILHISLHVCLCVWMAAAAAGALQEMENTKYAFIKYF